MLWVLRQVEMANGCSQEAGPAGPGGRATWRFCLVEPGDGEAEHGFPDLEALLAYLRRELEAG